MQYAETYLHVQNPVARSQCQRVVCNLRQIFPCLKAVEELSGSSLKADPVLRFSANVFASILTGYHLLSARLQEGNLYINLSTFYLLIKHQ